MLSQMRRRSGARASLGFGRAFGAFTYIHLPDVGSRSAFFFFVFYLERRGGASVTNECIWQRVRGQNALNKTTYLVPFDCRLHGPGDLSAVTLSPPSKNCQPP